MDADAGTAASGVDRRGPGDASLVRASIPLRPAPVLAENEQVTHATRPAGSSPSVLLVALLVGAAVLAPSAALSVPAEDDDHPTTITSPAAVSGVAHRWCPERPSADRRPHHRLPWWRAVSASDDDEAPSIGCADDPIGQDGEPPATDGDRAEVDESGADDHDEHGDDDDDGDEPLDDVDDGDEPLDDVEDVDDRDDEVEREGDGPAGDEPGDDGDEPLDEVDDDGDADRPPPGEEGLPRGEAASPHDASLGPVRPAGRSTSAAGSASPDSGSAPPSSVPVSDPEGGAQATPAEAGDPAAVEQAAAAALPGGSATGLVEDPRSTGLHAAFGSVSEPVRLPVTVALLVAAVMVAQGRFARQAPRITAGRARGRRRPFE